VQSAFAGQGHKVQPSIVQNIGEIKKKKARLSMFQNSFIIEMRNIKSSNQCK